ncbi:MAG: hypothetical protein CMH64_03130 [Nanoarchaeota archaeon]|nr:hypothetical protein [Nanoarchaeota archaeon]|tara:strand:- start:140 stop:340 length:201 start_codon:yes stop_codon:yes gene_type:complete
MFELKTKKNAEKALVTLLEGLEVAEESLSGEDIDRYKQELRMVIKAIKEQRIKVSEDLLKEAIAAS